MTKRSKDFLKYFEDIRLNILYLCEELNFVPSEEQKKELIKFQQNSQSERPRTWTRLQLDRGKGNTTLTCIILIWTQFQEWEGQGVVVSSTLRGNRIWLDTFKNLIHGAKPAVKRLIHISRDGIKFYIGKRSSVIMINMKHPEQLDGLHSENMLVILEQSWDMLGSEMMRRVNLLTGGVGTSVVAT